MPTRVRGAAFSAMFFLQRLLGVCAVPTINFSIDSQIPPLARISKPFKFTFAESTFISTTKEPISYALANAPTWLNFDPLERTLFGDVATDRPGSINFDVVASDSTGSISATVSVSVTDAPGPSLAKALLPQLGRTGRASAPDSLLLYPGEPFSIDFDDNTFSGRSGQTRFYATSADNSPLPSWLQFNSILRFSGIGPPLVSPSAQPQYYGVRLIASDNPGFADAVAFFQIVVAYKILAFAEATQWVKVSQGQKFSTNSLRDSLNIDGRRIADSELLSVTSDAPVWAELDKDRIRLQGTPPDDSTDQSVQVMAADVYGNVANTTVNLVLSESRQSLFAKQLPAINATIGGELVYALDPAILSSNKVRVNAELPNTAPWLTFDSKSLTFKGEVPIDIQPSMILVTLKATLQSITENKQLIVNITKNSTAKSSSPSMTRSGPGDTRPETTSNPDRISDRDRRSLVIVLAVLLPLLFLGFLCTLIACCYFRNRRRRLKVDKKTELNISRPMASSPTESPTAEIRATPMTEVMTPTRPPRIDLPWAPDSMKMARKRLSKMGNRDSALIDAGWGDFIAQEPEQMERSPKRQGNSGFRTPTTSGDYTPFVRSASNNLNYSRKRTPLRTTQSKVRKPSGSSRASKTPSRLSLVSTGLPTRLSGAGHGAGGPGPFVVRPGPLSWRNTTDSLFSDEGRRTTLDLSAFPDPPRASRRAESGPIERPARASVRLVHSGSSPSGSLMDQRQRWVRDRARDRHEKRSRFSHAWSSRGPSYVRDMTSSLRSPNNVKSGYFDSDFTSSRRSFQQSMSITSSVDMGDRPQSVDRMRGPVSRHANRPSNTGPALSTISSGRFDDSKSISSWIDDLMEEEDDSGNRRWVAVDNVSPDSRHRHANARDSEDPGQGSWGTSSRAAGLGHLNINIQGGGPGISSGERRWRLGGDQAKRPISVDEGDIQRSQGSQRGNLAFV